MTIIEQYFGPAPYYRNLKTGMVDKLPFRVRLSDGSTRTDPSQYSFDPNVLADIGYEITEVVQEDIDKVVPSLETLKSDRINEAQYLFNYKISQGFIVPDGFSMSGSKLGLTVDDVALLTGAFLLLKEGVALGIAETVSIIDIDGHTHSLTLNEMTAIMLQYGTYRANISKNYANLVDSINMCNSIEELNNIEIGENL